MSFLGNIAQYISFARSCVGQIQAKSPEIFRRGMEAARARATQKRSTMLSVLLALLSYLPATNAFNGGRLNATGPIDVDGPFTRFVRHFNKTYPSRQALEHARRAFNHTIARLEDDQNPTHGINKFSGDDDFFCIIGVAGLCVALLCLVV